LALLGQIVAYEPGQSLTTRRLLDLREDWFVHDHTIGGRAVSRIDPTQNGLPILPMTFSLEIMAELACTLLPGLVVTAIEQVKLLRWLPYDEATTTLEATATVLPEDGSGAAARQGARAGHRQPLRSGGVMAGQTAAEGVVVLATAYEPAPALDDSPLAQQRPCTVTHEVLYRNLFHGPLFQSVASLDHYGDDGLVGSVCVPPRDRWFASQRDPAVLLDPVLLDVAMHLLGAWHLEQPDWTGRILLPFELRRIEFFGPTPAARHAAALPQQQRASLRPALPPRLADRLPRRSPLGTPERGRAIGGSTCRLGRSTSSAPRTNTTSAALGPRRCPRGWTRRRLAANFWKCPPTCGKWCCGPRACA
jgi:hypothetical protein